VANKISDNEAQQAQILAAENVLAALRVQKAAIDEQLAEARRLQVRHEIHRDAVAEGIDTYGTQRTIAKDAATRLTAIGVDPVTESQREMLAPLLADAYTGDVNYLDTAIAKVRSRLSTQLTNESLRATNARAALERAFRTFKASWDNYDWGTDIESYRDYNDHLDMLQTTGLAEHRDQFAQKVARWSGADLVELKRAFRIARDSIQTRLDAVNRILDGIPFGAGKDRLHIKSKHHTNQLIAKFSSEIEVLASAATDFAADDMTSEEIDRRYRSIETFIKYLLPGDRLPKGEQSVWRVPAE
jgi:uncharacterized protein YPO0396